MQCTVPDCRDRAVAKGLCYLHYARKRLTNTTDPPPIKPPTLCHCGVKALAKGLCKHHYMKQWHIDNPGYREEMRHAKKAPRP